MAKPPKIFFHQKNLDDHLKNDQFKYSILLDLRDHEHKVLWQKFNVFLGFNTILIAIIAAVLSFNKNIDKTNPNYVLGLSSEFYLLFTIIFVVAYMCSIFLFNILRGSNFWITFWEGKLTSSEVTVSIDSSPLIDIFGDHASRVIQKIRENQDLLNELKERRQSDPDDEKIIKQIDEIRSEISTLQEKLKVAIKMGYVSTRNSMVNLVRIVMFFWGGAFVISLLILLYSLKIFNAECALGILFVIGCASIVIAYLIQWYFTKKKNETEMNKLLNYRFEDPIQNDKN